jgi:hypothetical protein
VIYKVPFFDKGMDPPAVLKTIQDLLIPGAAFLFYIEDQRFHEFICQTVYVPLLMLLADYVTKQPFHVSSQNWTILVFKSITQDRLRGPSRVSARGAEM